MVQYVFVHVQICVCAGVGRHQEGVVHYAISDWLRKAAQTWRQMGCNRKGAGRLHRRPGRSIKWKMRRRRSIKPLRLARLRSARRDCQRWTEGGRERELGGTEVWGGRGKKESDCEEKTARDTGITAQAERWWWYRQLRQIKFFRFHFTSVCDTWRKGFGCGRQ